MCLGDHISQNALRAPRTTIPRIPPCQPHTHRSQHAVPWETTKAMAPLFGAHFWHHSSDRTTAWSLAAPSHNHVVKLSA